MNKKRFVNILLSITLALVLGLIFSGCDDSSESLVNVRVINETGKAISDIMFTAPNGTIHMVEEIGRRGMGHQGQGHCWMNQDENYTLSWYCEVRGERIYAETGGLCGRTGNPHHFRFRNGQDTTIVLRDDDTWEFANS